MANKVIFTRDIIGFQKNIVSKIPQGGGKPIPAHGLSPLAVVNDDQILS